MERWKSIIKENQMALEKIKDRSTIGKKEQIIPRAHIQPPPPFPPKQIQMQTK